MNTTIIPVLDDEEVAVSRPRDNVLIEVYMTDSSGEGWDINADNEAAIKIADAIYTAAGKQIPAGVRASEVPLNEALIRVAAAHGAHIRFRYAKRDNAPVEAREFAPTAVRSFEDHVTFVGYDPDRGAMRSFRSDRIKGQVEVVSV